MGTSLVSNLVSASIVRLPSLRLATMSTTTTTKDPLLLAAATVLPLLCSTPSTTQYPLVTMSASYSMQMPMNNSETLYQGLKPGEVSTGTTIMAIPFAGGVILGADSRVSTGTYVANRVSDKIAQLSEHIFACRSGSAADTQALTDYVKHYLAQLTYVSLSIYRAACERVVQRSTVTVYSPSFLC